MPHRLTTSDAEFSAGFAALLSSKREDGADVNAAVAGIIADVMARGDEAVLELTRKFDQLDVSSMAELSLTPADLKAAYDRISPPLKDALTTAATRIRAFHEKQLPRRYRLSG